MSGRCTGRASGARSHEATSTPVKVGPVQAMLRSSRHQNLRQITTVGPIEAIQSANSTYGLLCIPVGAVAGPSGPVKARRGGVRQSVCHAEVGAATAAAKTSAKSQPQVRLKQTKVQTAPMDSCGSSRCSGGAFRTSKGKARGRAPKCVPCRSGSSNCSRQNLRQIATTGPFEANQSADSTYGLLRFQSVQWRGLPDQ